MRRYTALAACVVALAVWAPAVVSGQVLIKVNDDVNFKLGVLGQVQADTLEDPGYDSRQNNLFIRRLRLLFGGQVAKNVTFFVETDAPNLGKTIAAGKNITPSVIIQDAYVEWRFVDALQIDAGLMFVPFSRNSLQSAATLLPIDYSAYTFSQSAPTQSSTGRDTGFQAKGYFLENHLEYRLGVFQGVRDARSHNSFRYAGRAQYNVFDTETGFFYAGTYLGAKRMLAIGAGFDGQKDYHAYDGDLFFEYPLVGGALTTQIDITRFDGDGTLPTLPKQNDVLLEVGYLIKSLKLTPVVQYVNRDIVGLTKGDENRLAVGANYWWAGHNANVKFQYARINPTGAAKQNELTIQLQFFYF